MATAFVRSLAPDCDVVGVVADGRGAIDAANRLSPDVMLVDLNLPDMSGIEVCKLVMRASNHTKVILVSGLADPTIERLAHEAGATAFLSKTASRNELIAAIANALSDPPP